MASADKAMDGLYAENAGAIFGLLSNHHAELPLLAYWLPSGLLEQDDETCSPSLL
ncbi:hypothetical protein [Endozoicomonas acroporae]|uniref:hypothetical protein n=1 Tax=Endozoicomonas acroporae TaxID=1701104 RepID=UPI0013D89FCB|nr:hypothetical protein [Endozoicomonas acroporae]